MSHWLTYQQKEASANLPKGEDKICNWIQWSSQWMNECNVGNLRLVQKPKSYSRISLKSINPKIFVDSTKKSFLHQTTVVRVLRSQLNWFFCLYTIDHDDPSKPSHRLINGPKPLKTIESDGSKTKNHWKTIVGNGQTARKHSMVMVTVANSQ